MTEWFEQWFGDEYLQIYPHRDQEDAARMVGLIDGVVPLSARRVLDLACGSGRHAELLVARGARVVGFDLSMPLLRRARRRAAPFPLVRGDMRRLPFRHGAFDLVVNLFTSFGYFLEDEQNQLVLDEVATAVPAGGLFVLDYLNARHVRRHLVPHEERILGSRRVATERRLSGDGRYVIKEIHLMDEGRSFLERVRLFTAEDLTGMVKRAGFAVRCRFGDYEGRPLSDSAPRAILLAERS